MRWLVILMVVMMSMSSILTAEGTSLLQKVNVETKKTIQQQLKKKHNPSKMNLRISAAAQFRRDHS